MIPTPVVLGLIVCEQVIVDGDSGNPSLINIFSQLPVQQFPSEPKSISIFATLTDTEGTGMMELICLELDSGEELFSYTSSLSIVNRWF